MANYRYMRMSDLGTRIKEAAEEVGGLKQLSEQIPVARRTLGDWVDGSSEPKSSALADIARLTGVSIKWLVLGEGPKREPTEVTAAMPFDTQLLDRLAAVVTSAYRDAGFKIAPEKVAVEAGTLYNDLLRKVDDITDREDVEMLLPWLESRLRKRLEEATAKPGTGKRSA